MMRKLSMLLALLPLLLFLSCEKLGDDVELSPTQVAAARPAPPISAIGEVTALLRFENGKVSMDDAVAMLQAKYGIDYNGSYQQLMRTGNGVRALGDPNGRAADLDDLPISLEQLDSAYLALIESSAFRPYLEQVQLLLPSDDTDDDYQIDYQAVDERVYELKSAVEADNSLTETDKEIIYVALDVFKDNLEGIVALVAQASEEEVPIALSAASKLKNIWRKVRSIVVTTVVFTAATFLVLTVAVVAAPAVLTAAIIIGSIALAASTTDMLVNDRCWWAVQCDGAAQKCGTGECLKPGEHPAGTLPSTIFTFAPIINVGPEEELKIKWYNNKDIIICGRGGRCFITPGSLTFAKMHAWAQEHGIYDEVKRKYPFSPAQWNLYKCRLGSIFEDAAMRSLRVATNRRQVLLRTVEGVPLCQMALIYLVLHLKK